MVTLFVHANHRFLQRARIPPTINYAYQTHQKLWIILQECWCHKWLESWGHLVDWKNLEIEASIFMCYFEYMTYVVSNVGHRSECFLSSPSRMLWSLGFSLIFWRSFHRLLWNDRQLSWSLEFEPVSSQTRLGSSATNGRLASFVVSDHFCTFIAKNLDVLREIWSLDNKHHPSQGVEAISKGREISLCHNVVVRVGRMFLWSLLL